METTFDLPERGERQARERRKASRRISQGTVDELAARYLDGVPTPALAQQFKLGKATVVKLLHEAGVPMRRQGLPDDKVAEAAALYRSGQSLAKVAEHYGVSANGVYLKLLAAGVQMRGRHDRGR